MKNEKRAIKELDETAKSGKGQVYAEDIGGIARAWARDDEQLAMLNRLHEHAEAKGYRVVGPDAL